MGGHVIVVGSGPTGCAVARLVHERSPRTRLTMLEAGADPGTDARGQHVKNSQTYRTSNSAPTVFDLGAGGPPAKAAFRHGTTGFGSASSWGMPAAAVSTNVGGMGAYWTCAAPSPTSAERAEQLSRGEWESALSLAKRVLDVGGFHFPEHEASNDIVRRLRTEYTELSGEVSPGPTPLAATTRGGQPYWVGMDTILTDVLGSDHFELVDRAVCRRVLTSAGVVKGVAIRRDAAERDTVVPADAVVVACGPFRTPQLLWASGVRLPALGRYLYEHRQILGAVAYPARPSWHAADSDRTAGMYQVPYTAAHPWHGQIMHFDQQPIVAGRGLGSNWSVLGLSWFVPMAMSASNRVRFSGSHHDELGMPIGTVEFTMGEGAGGRIEGSSYLRWGLDRPPAISSMRRR